MRGAAPSGRGEFRPVYHPAGYDNELRIVLQDLKTGRWMSMRKLLTHTGADWTLRTSRTQVLAAVAAGSDVVQAWRAEEPNSIDALVMHARVSVERAVRARRDSHTRTKALGESAREICEYAAASSPRDPVPWICLLALAQLDDRQARPEHRITPPDRMLFPAPWGLLQEVHARDPFNREAYHRLLQFVYALDGGSLVQAHYFAEWVTERAPVGSPLLMLPLYVHAERYRAERGFERALDLHWIKQDAIVHVQRALQGWFDRSVPATRSLLDLNYLAHALWSVHQFNDAARVFEALGPYMTPLPWAYHTPDPSSLKLAEQEFLRARGNSLAQRDPRDSSQE